MRHPSPPRRFLDRLWTAWCDTLAQPSYGRPGWRFRILQLRLRHGLLLSLPALLIITWYTWHAALAHHRALGQKRAALSLELFQLHLHDLLSRDFHELGTRSTALQSGLEMVELLMAGQALDRLDARRPETDLEAGFEVGRLRIDKQTWKVRARYRGQKAWHYRYPQKSWKLRFQHPSHWEGHESILLLNSPDPDPLLELVLLEKARQIGLLVPPTSLVQLRLNASPMGVYLLETPADESTLRQNRRFPWSLYSGNGAPRDPKTGVSLLFTDTKYWRKAEGPLPKRSDYSELQALLEQLSQAAPADFADWARRHLDLNAFARLSAIDIAFGIDQHNYDENQKLYFDPYRGRFEPIVWNLRGADHEATYDRAPSPLMLRLAELPEFQVERDALVYRLLSSTATPQVLRAELEDWDAHATDAFEQDPFWDAAGILPEIGVYPELVRPMSRDQQLRWRQLTLHRLSRRASQLLDSLTTLDLQAELTPLGDGGARLSIILSGRTGLEVTSIKGKSTDDCIDSPIEAIPELPSQGGYLPMPARFNPGDLYQLLPGQRRIPRPAHASRGLVRLEPEPRLYSWRFAEEDRAVSAVTIRGRLLPSGQPFTRRLPLAPTPANAASTARQALQPCPVKFDPNPSAQTPHPWCFSRAAPEEQHFGPGIITISSTLRIADGAPVTIAPGTTFVMSRDSSLIFTGHVDAQGTETAPIRFVGTGWGSVILQGPATTGSRLKYVSVIGATRSKSDLIEYPAAVAIHDTSGITLSHVHIAPDSGGEDGLHLAYVRGATLDHVSVDGAHADGVDIEVSSVQAELLAVTNSGDDAIDLMSSDVRLAHTFVSHCNDNAVSAGERTSVTLSDSWLSGCPIGLLAKNASTARISSLLVTSAQKGARIEERSDWYTEHGQLLGEGLLTSGVAVPLDLRGHPRVEPIPRVLNTPDGQDDLLRGLGRKPGETADGFANRRRTEIRELGRPQ